MNVGPSWMSVAERDGFTLEREQPGRMECAVVELAGGGGNETRLLLYGLTLPSSGHFENQNPDSRGPQ